MVSYPQALDRDAVLIVQPMVAAFELVREVNAITNDQIFDHSRRFTDPAAKRDR